MLLFMQSYLYQPIKMIGITKMYSWVSRYYPTSTTWPIPLHEASWSTRQYSSYLERTEMKTEGLHILIIGMKHGNNCDSKYLYVSFKKQHLWNQLTVIERVSIALLYLIADAMADLELYRSVHQKHSINSVHLYFNTTTSIWPSWATFVFC